MLTIPTWMTVILKTIIGASVGTIAGGATGAALIFLITSNGPRTGNCSESIAMGAVAMGLLVVGGGVGFIVGTLTALGPCVHKARKAF